jgi:hypothetical protein
MLTVSTAIVFSYMLNLTTSTAIVFSYMLNLMISTAIMSSYMLNLMIRTGTGRLKNRWRNVKTDVNNCKITNRKERSKNRADWKKNRRRSSLDFSAILEEEARRYLICLRGLCFCSVSQNTFSAS